MHNGSVLVSLGMMVATIGCAGNDVGFYAQGSLRATVTQPGVATPTTTGFEFATFTRIDPSIPANATSGFTGTCRVGPTERTLHLQRIGGDELGLREVTIALPSWEAAATACPRGQISLKIGPTTFTGQHDCDDARSTCTFTTARRGSYGMELSVQCPQLQAAGDNRRVEFTGQLILDECDGPETRNPER